MSFRTIKDVYQEAIIEDFKSLIYFIEWLVYEQKAATMEHDHRNIDYLLNKYGPRLNPYIGAYKAKVEGQVVPETLGKIEGEGNNRERG
ncbi:hypothetical protein CR194_05010 [Salipaludibacillus keqinensis]|uniref:Uncharacterized protein n=1 Tax=Salipaludibacillus keqinensis TaxID=2045207 RepID=A0A323TLD3_9BACI|nr:hypothetical protein [Salipaludibacillus keqinensis]PYZ94886.1 hypothetical protein CR194_05010 [Salipaludibacillus keqinensis]